MCMCAIKGLSVSTHMELKMSPYEFSAQYQVQMMAIVSGSPLIELCSSSGLEGLQIKKAGSAKYP